MASPREPKGSTKIAVPAPIEQISQSTRNSTRPPPAPKNGRKFDAQVFLATIGEGRKAIALSEKANHLRPRGSRRRSFLSADGQGETHCCLQGLARKPRSAY